MRLLLTLVSLFQIQLDQTFGLRGQPQSGEESFEHHQRSAEEKYGHNKNAGDGALHSAILLAGRSLSGRAERHGESTHALERDLWGWIADNGQLGCTLAGAVISDCKFRTASKVHNSWWKRRPYCR